MLILLVAALGLIGWVTARARAGKFANVGRDRPHSLANYHGWYVALWVVVPALLFISVWAMISPGLTMDAVLSDPAAKALPANPMERNSVLSEVQGLADGSLPGAFNPSSVALVGPYKAASQRFALTGLALSLILAFAGGAYAYTRIKPDFRARTRVERVVMLSLLIASLIAILTTIGIVASLLLESARFFSMVSPLKFLTGLEWSPQSMANSGADDAFGAVPLFWGTVFIGAIIAMIVAVPLGLMSAIYLTQYAAPNVRKWMKPLLEILAGVPTVVYGYFAALTVAPRVRDLAALMGMDNPSSESALAAGAVMGIMIIPFVSSMADDSIAAVPQSMRDGSLAMGATKSETIRKVLLPAALPGVVGGVLLAVSRAIGETMIVVMAAGLVICLPIFFDDAQCDDVEREGDDEQHEA
jgi:phosphate transport system permease protein